MKLDPTGRRGDRLASVFRSPALYKGHPYCAHPRQRVDRLEALVDRLRE